MRNKKEFKDLTTKEKISGFFILGVIVLVLFAIFSPSDSKNKEDNSVATNTDVAKVQETPTQAPSQQVAEYEQLSYEELATIENFTYLYSGNDKSEEYLKSVLNEIRENNCKKPCNISLFDDRKAANLDSEMKNIRNETEEKEWKSKNYVYVADHFPAMWEFEGIFFYYPYKDWLYDSLK